MAECRKKDIDMMKERERTKGSAKERTHRSSRCCMEKVKVDTETTGHGTILGPTLGKVNQVYILMRNSTHDSPEAALLRLDWK